MLFSSGTIATSCDGTTKKVCQFLCCLMHLKRIGYALRHHGSKQARSDMQQGPQQVYRLSSLCLCKTSQVNSRGDETSSSTSFESHYLGTIPMIPLPSFQITIYNSSKSSITFVIQLSSPAVQHVILSTRGEHDF